MFSSKLLSLIWSLIFDIEISSILFELVVCTGGEGFLEMKFGDIDLSNFNFDYIYADLGGYY